MDAIISSVADRVVAVAADQIQYQVQLVIGVENEVIDLSAKLKAIKNVMDDAEKRGVNENDVKRWLKKLEDAAYEIDDILDEWKYTLLKHEMEDRAVVYSPNQKVWCSFSFIPSSCLSFKKVADRRGIAKKILNVKATLDQIVHEKDVFKFGTSLPVPKPSRLQSTSFIDVGKVHGVDIDRNKNDIVWKLMDNIGDSQTVCVVGMGGLGKTTLAQLVFNDTQVKGFFDLRIWICVSDPFDLDVIARGIVNKVGTETIPQNNYQLDLVLEKLRDSISGKKFFLVLDDVWTEDYSRWELLKMSLKDGAQGSKILVTTRKETVAKMMGTSIGDIYRPQKLTDEECWSLLRQISLSERSDEECGEFDDVGKIIARKCNGLPLAANVLGSILQFKDTLDKWEEFLGSEIWQLEKAELDLFPHLLLSYNELSPALKQCFSYCAVYPKGFQINAKNLIEEWMALGYLGYHIGNAGLELVGREYFNNLARRSLFQDFEWSGESGEEINLCKMHDIVHDFALFLRKNDERVETAEMSNRTCQVCNPNLVSQVQEYRSLVWGKESPRVVCDCLTNMRVLRFDWASHDTELLMCIPQGMEKLIHLRLLELSVYKLSEEDLKITCRLYFLQTLLLESCSIKEIPTEIGNLVHLRHLDLCHNADLQELTESICSLVELQTLLLAYCSLKEIPEKIGDLVHLRHLNLSWNKELIELPESMCNLLELQILNIEHCNDLYGLPQGIYRLESLQQLLTEFTPASYYFPQGLAMLSGLRTLSSFLGGSDWNELGLLKNLNRLTGYLTLKIQLSSTSDLEELAEDAREAKLRNKIHIHSLSILFQDKQEQPSSSPSSSSSSSSSPPSLLMDVIEALQPHQKLKKLVIGGYKGSRLPHWISSPLNLMKSIHLNYLSKVSSLPLMGKLPFLKYLNIEELKELKLVGREFLGIECSSSSSSSTSPNDVVVAFPKLKQLRFDCCDKWEVWEDITAEEEESAVVSIMPCLTKLLIDNCGGLKKLPHRLLRKASSSSLEFVDISSSPELHKSYGGEDGSPYLTMPCRNNPQLDIL